MYSPAARARLYAATPHIARHMHGRARRNTDAQVKRVAMKHRRQDYVKELDELRAEVTALALAKP